MTAMQKPRQKGTLTEKLVFVPFMGRWRESWEDGLWLWASYLISSFLTEQLSGGRISILLLSVFRIALVRRSSIRNIMRNTLQKIKFFTTLIFQSFTPCFMVISSILWRIARLSIQRGQHFKKLHTLVMGFVGTSQLVPLLYSLHEKEAMKPLPFGRGGPVEVENQRNYSLITSNRVIPILMILLILALLREK